MRMNAIDKRRVTENLKVIEMLARNAINWNATHGHDAEFVIDTTAQIVMLSKAIAEIYAKGE